MTTISASTLIPTMTATHLRVVLRLAWQVDEASPPPATLQGIDKLIESAVEALVLAGRDDDLDLAEGPLDVISDTLKSCTIVDAVGACECDDKAIEIYEALIDACHLPGTNAHWYTNESEHVDNEPIVLLT